MPGATRWRGVWASLLQYSTPNSQPWLVGGDFNVVSSASEKLGKRDITVPAVNEFNDFINSAGLIDAGYKGNVFTWQNKIRGSPNSWARLDRILINNKFLTTMPTIKVLHLVEVHSDHSPLLIQPSSTNRSPSTFKFLRMWLSHEDFLACITQSWSAPAQGSPIFALQQKWKKLKRDLKQWNITVFGNIRRKLNY